MLVIGIQRNSDDAGTFGGLDGDLGLERRRQNPNGLGITGIGVGIIGLLGSRDVVERGLRQVGDRNDNWLAVSSLGLGGVESEENGLKPGEGWKRSERVGGERVDSGEVEAGEEREEGEDDES